MARPSDDPLDRLCRLARLSRPTLDHDELQQRLAAVVKAFADLKEVDTDALAEAEAEEGRLRSDEPGPVLSVAEALANSARTAADCFLCPRVVEG
ncbi:MAG: Asp-tRNA(Asn)/Glu-tRNA(Gln) amidotransferase subunit GatC [Planctomycetota bacterium]